MTAPSTNRFALNSYCLKFHVGLNKGKALDAGLKPTANFIRRTKDLPKISQPTSCGTAGTECKKKRGELTSLWTHSYVLCVVMCLHIK